MYLLSLFFYVIMWVIIIWMRWIIIVIICSYHHTTDPTIYRSVYSSPMIYPGSSSTNLVPQPPMPPPPPPYPYSSNQYSPHNHFNDYYLNPSFRGSRSISPSPNLPTTTTVDYMADSPVEPGYTCVGAPIGPTGFPIRGPSIVRAPLEPPQGRDGDASRQRLDHSLRFPINRFQDHHSLWVLIDSLRFSFLFFFCFFLGIFLSSCFVTLLVL